MKQVEISTARDISPLSRYIYAESTLLRTRCRLVSQLRIQ